MADDEEYDLQVLLELREREKDQAEQEYAEELQELERREDYLETKRQELQEAVEKRERECEKFDRRKVNGDVRPNEYRQFEKYVEGMRLDEQQIEEAIVRAEEAVEEQQEYVDEARERMAEATKQLKAVERHKEDWEEEQEMKAKREQSAQMDQVASRIWREQNS